MEMLRSRTGCRGFTNPRHADDPIAGLDFYILHEFDEFHDEAHIAALGRLQGCGSLHEGQRRRRCTGPPRGGSPAKVWAAPLEEGGGRSIGALGTAPLANWSAAHLRCRAHSRTSA